ncbi:pyridoxamine 5'-phosphate oxidase family protein [Methylobacterium oryzihabitans]|uniref:Pyridoxamine 5'-phosphate oxidase family protein n=1 Tax=Methylobacterium oryzihabitans TaxID=2499852 RepID=A0A437P698_9HYPH|nr:pyridoxamine 5'-phosphate oxidase family protein [Methylobacterium oryzihabitans]RVU17783.1 pyridoxamine 5'-phosphate oxidase family protein [Methylobacterium oryzihabitans]
MASLYSEAHRDLQAAFGTTRLAERLDADHVHDTILDDERAFIEGRDMLFLSTVDPDGNPTVSYKGGAPGFMRVTGPATLVFPGYDGNGMFYSAGNIAGQNRVGLLFIDFETPHRLRLQGTAHLDRDAALLAGMPGAQYLVRVEVAKVWVNCPRYVHTYRKVHDSRYVPEAGREAPLALWKRLDLVQDVLPEDEVRRAKAEGVLDPADYTARVMRGEG